MSAIKILNSSEDSKGIRFSVNSASDARRRYTIVRRRRQWQCSCPVWIFRRKVCKHIKVVRAAQ